MSKITHSIGVDEAGRGPLAGPVAVGIAMIPYDFDWSVLPNVGDSKRVSPKNREAIFRAAQKLKKQGVLNYAVILIPERTIDRINISRAVFLGIEKGFKKLKPDPRKTHVKLDGLLRAPEEFLQQETIIKGDAKEKVIGLASILAKVTRDPPQGGGGSRVTTRSMASIFIKATAHACIVQRSKNTVSQRSIAAHFAKNLLDHTIKLCTSALAEHDVPGIRLRYPLL